MTRRDLMERLGVDELKEQIAFERIYPFEDGYWQAARISLTLAECHGVKGAKFDRYLPKRDVPRAKGKPGKIRVDPGVLRRIQSEKQRHGYV